MYKPSQAKPSGLAWLGLDTRVDKPSAAEGEAVTKMSKNRLGGLLFRQLRSAGYVQQYALSMQA